MARELRVNNSKFIDQTTRVSFKFNGQTLYGFKGDTLASALLAKHLLKDYILIAVGVQADLKRHLVLEICLLILLLMMSLIN